MPEKDIVMIVSTNKDKKQQNQFVSVCREDFETINYWKHEYERN